jgi:hypothetical protein
MRGMQQVGADAAAQDPFGRSQWSSRSLSHAQAIADPMSSAASD